MKRRSTPQVVKKKVSKLSKSFKRIWSDLLLLLIPLVLLAVLLVLMQVNLSLKKEIVRNKLSNDLEDVTIHPYPVVNTLFDPVISAESAIIMDDTSKAVLYVKNPTVRFSMASTTKLMTALAGLDYYSPSSILTIYNDTLPPSKVGFSKGEQITFLDALYGMFLPSGNDAAYAVADNYPGGEKAFIKKMNEKAKALHLSNTSFGDPAGLDDDLDYTTVLDLARLTSVAIKNPLIAKIIDTKDATITTLQGTQYPVHNLNKLLGTDGVNGVKTGFTSGAGGVLITSKVYKGHTFIIIVMKSEDRFIDTEHLLSLLTDQAIVYIRPFFSPLKNNVLQLY